MSDDFETPSPIVLILEVVEPMCLATVVASPFLVCSGLREPTLLALFGAIWGACFIRMVVRWLTRRDDPRHERLPADPPD